MSDRQRPGTRSRGRSKSPPLEYKETMTRTVHRYATDTPCYQDYYQDYYALGAQGGAKPDALEYNGDHPNSEEDDAGKDYLNKYRDTEATDEDETDGDEDESDSDEESENEKYMYKYKYKYKYNDKNDDTEDETETETDTDNEGDHGQTDTDNEDTDQSNKDNKK